MLPLPPEAACLRVAYHWQAWERSVRELFLSTLTDDKLYASLAPRPRRTQGPSGNVTSNASTAAAAKLLVASSLRDDGILKPNELSRYDTLMNTGQVNNVVNGNQRTHPEPEHIKIASWTPGYFTQTLPPMTARASPKAGLPSYRKSSV